MFFSFFFMFFMCSYFFFYLLENTTFFATFSCQSSKPSLEHKTNNMALKFQTHPNILAYKSCVCVCTCNSRFVSGPKISISVWLLFQFIKPFWNSIVKSFPGSSHTYKPIPERTNETGENTNIREMKTFCQLFTANQRFVNDIYHICF